MVWIILLVILGFALILVFYAIGIYNRLIQVTNDVEKTCNDINIGLKQRHDELPKLIEVCKGYMKYEQNLLTRITELRTKIMSASSLKEQSEVDGELSKALKSLFAVAENYPQLKASENFNQLQSRVSAIETNLAGFRAVYNNAANIYNITIQQIPYVFLASSMGYTAKEMFQVPQEEQKDVEIKF